MLIDVIMPKLGESITEATILEWKKKIGDSIDKDENVPRSSTSIKTITFEKVSKIFEKVIN